jgi:hypothetical protein
MTEHYLAVFLFPLAVLVLAASGDSGALPILPTRRGRDRVPSRSLLQPANCIVAIPQEALG